jgi:cyclomaltodextrinase
MSKFKLGRYQHFKGGLYEVLGVAKHSETLKELVVYKHLDTGEIWVRPKEMFLEKIVREGKKIPRFEYLGK